MAPAPNLTTKEATAVINEANLLPAGRLISKRSVERLCRIGSIPGAYIVHGDWCIPQASIDKYIEAVRSNTLGRPPRKKKTL